MNDSIKSKDVVITRRKRRRKPLKPKTKARKLYEEQNPSISVRVDWATKMQFLVDAKQNGLKQKDYISLLINNGHLNIERIKNEAFTAGQESMRPLIDEAHEQGMKERAKADVENIWRMGMKTGERSCAIYIRCANHVYGCQYFIPVERGTELEYIAVNALEEQHRFICKECEWRQIARGIAEEMRQISAPKPSPMP